MPLTVVYWSCLNLLICNRMKKFLPVALVLIVLLAGFGFYLFGRQATVPSSEKTDSVETVPEQASPQAEEKSGVISSIKDAMGLGKKMQCTYTDKDDSSVSSTIFIDGQKFKFTSEMNGEKMYGLFDGETQYTWTTGKEKQGWKMTKACLEELGQTAKQVTEGQPSSTPEDYQAAFDNAENVACAPAANEDFSVPTDIVFTDQCEMLKNSMKALESMKGQLPAGMNIPGY